MECVIGFLVGVEWADEVLEEEVAYQWATLTQLLETVCWSGALFVADWGSGGN